MDDKIDDIWCKIGPVSVVGSGKLGASCHGVKNHDRKGRLFFYKILHRLHPCFLASAIDVNGVASHQVV